jgi:peptidoglycan hydrolase-like protein with peptidoglycan-binding domain
MARLLLLLLTACVASPSGEHQAETRRPAVDRLLNRGDFEVARLHWREFGCDPGPINVFYSAQTQAAVWAFQATYGLSESGLLDRHTREQLKVGADPNRGNQSLLGTGGAVRCGGCLTNQMQ